MKTLRIVALVALLVAFVAIGIVVYQKYMVLSEDYVMLVNAIIGIL